MLIKYYLLNVEAHFVKVKFNFESVYGEKIFKVLSKDKHAYFIQQTAKTGQMYLISKTSSN